MKLYVVRHGATDWNAKHVFQGDNDIPLNDIGRNQALIVKEKLKDKTIDLCFTSPLSRTRETASIITDNKIPIFITSMLTERNFGDYEGMKIEEVTVYDKYWDYKLNLKDNGVEGVRDLFKRVSFFLKFIDDNYDDGNILIVSHGATIRALNYLITGFSEDENFLEFDVKNCSVFEYDL